MPVVHILWSNPPIIAAPVIIFGLSKRALERCALEGFSVMPKVFAGRLEERYDGDRNRGLLLAPGPMAGSVPAKGIVETLGINLMPDAGLLLLVRDDEDSNGCAAYLVMVDTFGAVDGIVGRDPKDWRGYQACLEDVFRILDREDADDGTVSALDTSGLLY